MTPHPRRSTRPAAPLAWIACLSIALTAAPLTPADAQERRAPVRLRPVERPRWEMLLGDGHHTGLSGLSGPRKGEVVWSADLGGGLLATPAVDAAGRSYWPTQAGELVVLGPDGALLRRLPLRQGSNSAPVLGPDGSLYAADRSGQVTRFDPEGQPRWSTPLDAELISSPTLDAVAGLLYISVLDRTVALDLETGAVAWQIDLGNGRYNSSPSLGPDGLVRITNWDGWFLALGHGGTIHDRRRVMRPGRISTPTLDPFGISYIAAETGEVMALSPSGLPRWSVRLGGPILSFMALLPDGRLLVPVTGLGLQAIWPSGRLSWAWLQPGARPTPTLAVSREGVTYLSDLDGTLTALSSEGVPLWSLATHTPLGSGPVLAPPVRGWPRALIGTRDGHVLCIE